MCPTRPHTQAKFGFDAATFAVAAQAPDTTHIDVMSFQLADGSAVTDAVVDRVVDELTGAFVHGLGWREPAAAAEGAEPRYQLLVSCVTVRECEVRQTYTCIDS